MNKISEAGFKAGFVKKLLNYIKDNPWKTAVGLGTTGVVGAMVGDKIYENEDAGPMYGFAQGVGMPVGALLGYGLGEELSQKHFQDPSLAALLGMPSAGLGAMGSKKLIDAIFGKNKPELRQQDEY